MKSKSSLKKVQVRLESQIAESFRCAKAANSLDIDQAKKSIHELNLEVDVDSPYSVGLILGASGSGKTTLARELFGADCFKEYLKNETPVIDQFPEEWSYDQCADALSGMGLTSVPCWIRPVFTLSNGQKARAEAALGLACGSGLHIIDEWTSVVDRTVAKVMSHCVQKFARKNKKQIVLLSCHYDVIEWLNPDWVIDCNTQTFTDRRSLRPARVEQLEFQVRETDSRSWSYFSKYHYLSDKLPAGKRIIYGLFSGENQIGFICFSNYVPKTRAHGYQFHFNRLVVHPDYAGFGLGVKFLNAACTACFVKMSGKIRILGAFSSAPMVKHLARDPRWRLRKKKQWIKSSTSGKSMMKKTFRAAVTMYSFEWRAERSS